MSGTHPQCAGCGLNLSLMRKVVFVPEQGKDHKLVVLLQILPKPCRLLSSLYV